jgi:DnaA N-terminal domain/IclR helix-turn-helix domain
VNAALPPSYVNTPVPIAYAEVDDALIVTMTRILGLCWAYDYERTPALTAEQVVELTGRPRSTLYRHLKQLRDMQWLRIDQVGRRIILHPVIALKGEQAEKTPTSVEQPTGVPAPNEALLLALAEIGIENPKRSQLACQDIDPLWVRAWHLWARHPHRQSLTNPVGNIILKLESGEQPPGEFLRAAEEQIRLHEWMREQEEHEAQNPEEDDSYEPDPKSVPLEALRIWADSLSELQLQMTRATFDTWLRGSQVVEADDGCLTIAVRHASAVDWLQNRLLPVIQRTVAKHAGGDVQIKFVAST